MEISTLDAFLQATSRPVHSNSRHCFDRLPQAMNQLIVECLFPVRQADEEPVYRFMRVQLAQSRQSTYPGIFQILYRGYAREQTEDLTWKNRLDYTCRAMQQQAAQNIFSHFFRDPFRFTNSFHILAPSSAFNQRPCMTYIQRQIDAEGNVEGEGINNSPGIVATLFNREGQEVFQDSSERQNRPPSSRMSRINAYLLNIQGPEIFLGRDNPLNLENRPLGPQNRRLNSRKVRFLAVCIAIAAVLYTVCRAVVNIFRATLPLLLIVGLPFLIKAVATVMSHVSLLKKIVFQKLLSSPHMTLKVALISKLIFFAMGYVGLAFIWCTMLGVEMHLIKKIESISLRMYNQAKSELSKTWEIGKTLFRERTRLAQMILLRTTQAAGAA